MPRKEPRPVRHNKLQNEKKTCCQGTRGYHRGKASDESYADDQKDSIMGK